jgi:formylglycine-generating enzyme required for sulfatase activity
MPARRRASPCIAIFGAVAALAACSEATPRPQIVVVVDTDAPLTGQALLDETLSPDAAVDTLRIDVFDDTGYAYDFRDFVAPDPSDWPLSFGVATPESAGAGRVHLRIRAFRGGLATSQLLNGEAVLEPRPEIAIDRLVDLDLPGEGIQTVFVPLSFDCLGVTPSFVQPRTTCIDAARADAPATSGVTTLANGETPATRAGTAARAREVACAGEALQGTICIPGGFTVLGDPALWGVADGLSLEDALPLRPVIVSPFLLDATEVTVGRVRALLQAGMSIGAPPRLKDPADTEWTYCTFLGEGDPSNDALPLNCVSWDTARRICETAGGSLPTEAQWEHAARGRGEGRDYPWGDDSPSCCTASVARGFGCPGDGPEPVGSHPPEACSGLGDVSRDGVVDMGGGLTELLLDKWRPYDHPCWGSGGILTDPVCEDETASLHAARGGDWSSGEAVSLSALRHSGHNAGSVGDGLRCAYGVAP